MVCFVHYLPQVSPPSKGRKNLGLPWSPRPTKFTGGTAAITGGLGAIGGFFGNPGFGRNKLLIKLVGLWPGGEKEI